MQQFKPEENSSKIINLYRSNTKLLKVLKSTTLTTQRGRGRATTKKKTSITIHKPYKFVAKKSRNKKRKKNTENLGKSLQVTRDQIKLEKIKRMLRSINFQDQPTKKFR